jgi:uncharacterized membrane protein YbaN (DUF454 family)
MDGCSILSDGLDQFPREVAFPMWFRHVACSRSDNVERDGLREVAPVEQAGEPESEAAFFCLDIEIDERAGLVRVHDPRMFRAGQHSFCKRLLAAASEQREIRRAEVNLATGTCWIEFGPGLGSSQALAGAFIQAVRQASVGTRTRLRRSWWQRIKDSFRRNRYRRSNGLVPWEALELEPGRIEIDVQGLRVDRDEILRLTESVTGVEAIEVYHVMPSSGRIAIRFRPERSEMDRLLDGVERALVSIQGDQPRASSLLALPHDWARSSVSLNEWLRRTPCFGPILEEWEDHGCLSRSSKCKLIGLSFALTFTMVIVLPTWPAAWVMLAVFSSLTVIGIAGLPAFPHERRTRLQKNRGAWLSLPSF